MCVSVCVRACVCVQTYIYVQIYIQYNICVISGVCVCVCMYVYASIRQSQDFLSRQRKIVNFCVDIDCTAPCGFTVVVCVWVHVCLCVFLWVKFATHVFPSCSKIQISFDNWMIVGEINTSYLPGTHRKSHKQNAGTSTNDCRPDEYNLMLSKWIQSGFHEY